MPVRLMIVDDHADVRFLIRAIVDEAAAGVVVAGEAEGAEAALAALDAVDPDVVVLDALMPLVDGYAAAPRLLHRRPGLPILLCSAVVDDEVRERARRAGSAGCVSKDELERIPALAVSLAATMRGSSPK